MRVGGSIRVDAVDRLTNYLQTLERAQQFKREERRPRFSFFVSSNAVAEDIVTRLNELIERDRQIDPRIQISADPRTNSVVMESSRLYSCKKQKYCRAIRSEDSAVEITSRIVEVQKTNSDLFEYHG